MASSNPLYAKPFGGSKFPVVLRVFVNAAGKSGPLSFNVLDVQTPTWHTAIQSLEFLLELWVKPHSPWFLLKIREERATSPRVYGRSWHIVAPSRTSVGHLIAVTHAQWL
ncbi:hypothetical protein N7533_013364 [Penicillium manginii]|jgi:hypothetical protein|uniref:uncharacterized protein n=1 Tax=Penicillium manginii TaxID=203109 RepID=UPI0025489E9B|nr:uncharacterized protein N7533_013364 [Penicillium manginii]KAJ5732917.1 hypothetical protein N7533_013364 [Penicillium manginii]